MKKQVTIKQIARVCGTNPPYYDLCVNGVIQNRRLVNHDHMPVQVATEMLCAPRARMTSRERKQCERARERIFESTLSGQTPEARLAFRVSSRPIESLAKWIRRAARRRKDVQAKYGILCRRRDKLNAKTGEPAQAEILELLGIGRALAALEIRAKLLEMVLDAAQEEVKRRERLVESLRFAAPGFAAALEKKLEKV